MSLEAIASINPAKADCCSVIVNCPTCPEDFSSCPENFCGCPEDGISSLDCPVCPKDKSSCPESALDSTNSAVVPPF